jgi:hypothetical protein
MKILTCTVEDKILHVLQRTGPCSLDDVVQQLLHHDWSEVFAEVDRMSRDGRIVLRRDPGSLGYRLSLPLSHDEAVRMKSTPVRFCVGCGYLCDEIRPEDGQGQWMDAHRYLDKYRLHWSDLDRTDDACPHCARVLACAHRRAPAETARAASSAL